ncbi:MAG: hypothetical protein IIU14_01550 [Ruminococcus sp.]|nr:hypothetical protein [Ruminococcus sp.]
MNNRLYLIALILFFVSMSLLIAAMIVHAVLGDDQLVTVFLAGGSGLSALIGIIFACLSKRKRK